MARARSGTAIAGEARPTAERGGDVTVSCSASVWAQELDLMAPAILERLNCALRRRVIAPAVRGAPPRYSGPGDEG